MGRCALLLGLLAACGRIGFDPSSGVAFDGAVGDGVDGAGDGGAIGGAPTLDLSVGGGHVCALKAGAVRCWGDNAYGQLGQGNVTVIGDNETAAQAIDVPLGQPAVEVAAGYQHTCARLMSGDVRCWGRSNFGQLGLASAANRGDNESVATTPNVPLGGRRAVALETSANHTCALLDDGAMICWGENANGRLGYGNTENIGDDEAANTAGTLPLPAPVVEMAVGHGTTCVRHDTGVVRCWGSRAGYGDGVLIGDDEPASAAGPVPIGGRAVQITAGGDHVCALLDTGAARCWGSSSIGLLGYGQGVMDIGDNEPGGAGGDVPAGGTIVEIRAGQYHTCARFDTGTMRCWGSNQWGQLGTGTLANIGRDEPASTALEADVGARVISIATGFYATCVRVQGNAIRCWGAAGNGHLGYGPGVTMQIGDDEPAGTGGDVPY